ncbi:MAG: hypothetical protein ACRDSP_12180 [Pseudonocardiaceae bacterium]
MATDQNTPQDALGREVERHARRLDRVEQLLRVLSQDITELHHSLEPTQPPQPEVRAWLLDQDTTQAREDLADLLDWLARVYLHYPDAGLVSCWLWHPAVVEELWWLRQAHHDAYTSPHACSTKAGDWHDRQRPGVTKRIRSWLRDCDLPRHQQPLPATAVPLAGSADRIAHTWAATRDTPVPTAEELAAAEDHDRAQHRSHHR